MKKQDMRNQIEELMSIHGNGKIWNVLLSLAGLSIEIGEPVSTRDNKRYGRITLLSQCNWLIVEGKRVLGSSNREYTEEYWQYTETLLNKQVIREMKLNINNNLNIICESGITISFVLDDEDDSWLIFFFTSTGDRTACELFLNRIDCDN